MKSYPKGISILEVVVSIMIVSFVLVGMLHLYSLGAIQANLARHKVMAINIAQAEIESLINVSYEGINFGSYPVTKTVKIDTGKTGSTGDDINGTMVTTIVTTSEGYKVTITVSWNDYYGAMNEVAESTIASYL